MNELKTNIHPLEQAAIALRKEGYRIMIHRQRGANRDDILRLGVTCAKETMDEEMTGIRRLLDNSLFLVYKMPNEGEIIVTLDKN